MFSPFDYKEWGGQKYNFQGPHHLNMSCMLGWAEHYQNLKHLPLSQKLLPRNMPCGFCWSTTRAVESNQASEMSGQWNLWPFILKKNKALKIIIITVFFLMSLQCLSAPPLLPPPHWFPFVFLRSWHLPKQDEDVAPFSAGLTLPREAQWGWVTAWWHFSR